MHIGIKQEEIQVEDMPEDDDEDNPPNRADRDSIPPMASLGRCKRVRAPSQMLISMMKGKHHD